MARNECSLNTYLDLYELNLSLDFIVFFLNKYNCTRKVTESSYKLRNTAPTSLQIDKKSK